MSITGVRTKSKSLLAPDIIVTALYAKQASNTYEFASDGGLKITEKTN